MLYSVGTDDSSAVVQERLTELVIALTGADDTSARVALHHAVDRHGIENDKLLSLADALVSIRGDESSGRARVGVFS